MKTSSCSTIPRISVAKPTSDAGLWSATVLRWSSKTIGNLMQWQGRVTQRRQLNELDDRLLADIGVTRIDACNESRKHFWQA